jgi:protein-arginine kinase activator protein McsA
MKIFLRSSFFTTKTPSRVSKNTETRISRKISNLEEYLFDEIKKENFSETETLPDICYIT